MGQQGPSGWAGPDCGASLRSSTHCPHDQSSSRPLTVPGEHLDPSAPPSCRPLSEIRLPPNTHRPKLAQRPQSHALPTPEAALPRGQALGPAAQVGGGEAQPWLPLFSVSLSGYLDTVGQFKGAGSKASPSPLWVTEACLRAGIWPDNLLLGWPPGLGSRPLYRKDFHSESKAGLSDLNRARPAPMWAMWWQNRGVLSWLQ